MFGGFDGNSQLNDVHVLDQKEVNEEGEVQYAWTQPHITGKAPCGRYGHTASVVGSKIYIFGGNAGTNMRLNDMHILDTDEMHWITPLVGGAAPWERSGHTASVIGGRVFIFGGFSYAGGEWLNDTHIFNTGSLKWRRATTTGAPPSGRNYHTASVVGKRIFIFGGFGNNVWLNDMHIFDSESCSWALPGESAEDEGEPPAEHSDHVAFVIGKNVFIFGGYYAKKQLNDLHLFDTVRERWMRPGLTGSGPCGRNYHTASVVDNRVFIFGGYDGHKMLNDVHVLRLEGVELIKKQHEIQLKFDGMSTQLQAMLLRSREELHDAFQEDINTQREFLDGLRKNTTKELEAVRALIEKEKLILKKEKKMVKEIKKGQSSRVKLNIGGHKFETSLATLTKHGGSMFAAMFSGRHHVEPDEDGFYFVDRDGTHFIHILNFLRDGTLNIPDDRFLHNWLINEANFYSLPDLDKLCRKALKHKEKREPVVSAAKESPKAAQS